MSCHTCLKLLPDRCYFKLRFSVLQLEHLDISFHRGYLLLMRTLHGLHGLLKLNTMLPKLLVLSQKRHSLLLSRFTAFLSLNLSNFELLHLVLHSSHDLFFDLPQVALG